MMQGQQPIMVINTNTQREHGRKAQLSNVSAGKAVADIVRTCLGPRAMLKMMLDPMGGVVITNDGNAILREIDVSHPAAKSIIELARAQDEEVGDGTTSVIILTGEVLAVATPFLERLMHPTQIVSGYYKALDDAVEVMKSMSVDLDLSNRSELLAVVDSCLGTKFVTRWGKIMTNLALDAVMTVMRDVDGQREIDFKRYAHAEKIPGGEIEDCRVIDGVMINKDLPHPKMRRIIENPRIILVDTPLEYKKGESMTEVQMTSEADFQTLLKMEEEYIERMCNSILAFKPDIVCTEKGLSDLAQHYFVKHGVTAFRRLRKTDNNRLARACGATIVSRPDELRESDVGTGCGLFEVRKIGDEFFAFFEKCKNPKACSILLRGAGKDVLNEVERNLQDAMSVARNILMEPRLLPGGGATEMAIAVALQKKSQSIEGVAQYPYRAIGQALEVIPRTLAQNCGANVVRVVTALRAKQAEGARTFGINGNTGELADMNELGIWEPYSVKSQTLKTAVEAACMLLRIDDIVSGLKKKQESRSGPAQQVDPAEAAGAAEE
jgi:T-complex protein 1 subunit gamma